MIARLGWLVLAGLAAAGCGSSTAKPNDAGALDVTQTDAIPSDTRPSSDADASEAICGPSDRCDPPPPCYRIACCRCTCCGSGSGDCWVTCDLCEGPANDCSDLCDTVNPPQLCVADSDCAATGTSCAGALAQGTLDGGFPSTAGSCWPTCSSTDLTSCAGPNEKCVTLAGETAGHCLPLGYFSANFADVPVVDANVTTGSGGGTVSVSVTLCNLDVPPIVGSGTAIHDEADATWYVYLSGGSTVWGLQLQIRDADYGTSAVDLQSDMNGTAVQLFKFGVQGTSFSSITEYGSSWSGTLQLSQAGTTPGSEVSGSVTGTLLMLVQEQCGSHTRPCSSVAAQADAGVDALLDGANPGDAAGD